VERFALLEEALRDEVLGDLPDTAQAVRRLSASRPEGRGEAHPLHALKLGEGQLDNDRHTSVGPILSA
jgi:hypothetical protein